MLITFGSRLQSRKNVPANEIKRPFTTGKSSSHWNEYVDKVFFDEGSGKSDDKDYFEPGTFVVKTLTADNNFLCTRVDVEGDEGVEFDIGYVIRSIRKYEEE